MRCRGHAVFKTDSAEWKTQCSAEIFRLAHWHSRSHPDRQPGRTLCGILCGWIAYNNGLLWRADPCRGCHFRSRNARLVVECALACLYREDFLWALFVALSNFLRGAGAEMADAIR